MKLITDLTRARLTQARHDLGLSQEALAQRMECSRNMLALMEIGQRDPSYDMLAKWCRALGLRVDVMIRGWPVQSAMIRAARAARQGP